MIINMQEFTAKGSPLWDELDHQISLMADNTSHRLSLQKVRRLHYLYSRSCADLSEMRTYGVERELCAYLEALCARAYAELHTMKERSVPKFNPWHWLSCTFPQTVRRHWTKLLLSFILTVMGVSVGASLMAVDPSSKEIMLPYAHLAITPTERVAKEESRVSDPYEGRKLSGSIWYLTHNTRVSYTVLASGVTCGILTFLFLFSNGILLGAICFDYIVAGEGLFLSGWLLPHGAIEIPGILIAGEAGLIIAAAMIGGRTRLSLAMRLRQIVPDITTLAIGIMLMMGWAGFVEALFSQYHEPVVPYWFKITFGTIQLLLLAWYLCFAGRKNKQEKSVE